MAHADFWSSASGDLALARARNFILQHGGLAKAGVFTRFWLSYFRQYPDRGIPAVPVELMLIPDRWPLSIYELSSWARGTVVPMAVLQALDFRVPLEPGRGVEEPNRPICTKPTANSCQGETGPSYTVKVNRSEDPYDDCAGSSTCNQVPSTMQVLRPSAKSSAFASRRGRTPWGRTASAEMPLRCRTTHRLLR